VRDFLTSHRRKIGFALGLAIGMGTGVFALPAVLYEKLPQPLPFDHVGHTAQGEACEDCHALLSDGRMSGLPRVAKCAECHASAIGESEGEKALVARFVEPGVEVPWHVYARQPDNVFFPHVTHTKLAELPCERCHGGHGRTTELRPYERNRVSGYSRDLWGAKPTRLGREAHEGMKMGDCVACHRERGVHDACLDCHK
jgi:hypothetical protein